MKALDITGQKFGTLTAVRAHTVKLWVFKCDCGKRVLTSKHSIVSGRAKTCVDCGRKVRAKKITKHGLSRSNEFYRFYQAKQRCQNHKSQQYYNYGGRGIKWLFNSYEEIYAELGPCPKGKSLDRKHNDGHYEPGNVRWATPREQQLNRRTCPKRWVFTKKCTLCCKEHRAERKK